MKNSNIKWLVFSDLDGTLLDSQTYSFLPATEGINFLRDNRIPLILSTSKTYPEVKQVSRQARLHAPFVVENGSAVFLPADLFPTPEEPWQRIDDYHVHVFGKPYAEVLSFLDTLRRHFNLDLRGFHEMTVKEIRNITGLNEPEVRLAKERLFSEPFVVKKEPFDFDMAQKFARKHGFRLLHGNRFYHLLGNCDKGMAVTYLIDLYRNTLSQELKSVALGDSPNDKDMLLAVDIPVIVRRPDGRYATDLELPALYRTQHCGPRGWNEAVLKLINL